MHGLVDNLDECGRAISTWRPRGRRLLQDLAVFLHYRLRPRYVIRGNVSLATYSFFENAKTHHLYVFKMFFRVSQMVRKNLPLPFIGH